VVGALEATRCGDPALRQGGAAVGALVGEGDDGEFIVVVVVVVRFFENAAAT